METFLYKVDRVSVNPPFLPFSGQAEMKGRLMCPCSCIQGAIEPGLVVVGDKLSDVGC